MTWLQNLLSENEQTRDDWARIFGITNRTTFEYLRHVGHDLAGSIQILPNGEPPSTSGVSIPVDDHVIAAEIRRIKNRQAKGGFTELRAQSADEDLHLSSVSGQQSKFTLTRLHDGWGVPVNGYPSTHILKFGFDQIDGSDLVEYVTMSAARSMGIATAETAVGDFDGDLAVVVSRFDRVLRDDGQVMRLHQEDMCQALGVAAAQKYESDGGPGMQDIVDVIDRATISPADRAASQRLFVQAVVFNLLSGGIDAHGKNYSLLHIGQRTRLAPLYDLNSGFLLLSGDEMRFRRKTAMKYGKEYRSTGITGRDLARTADSLRVSREQLHDVLIDQAATIADAFSDARKSLPASLQASFPVQNWSDSIVGQVASLRRSVEQMPSSHVDLAYYTPETHLKPQIRETWVPGHSSEGRWAEGRYTTRPSRS